MKNFIYIKWIGKQVAKESGKPFKNGDKVVTINDICINPNTGLPAFKFEENSTIVDCHQCQVISVGVKQSKIL